MEMCVETTDKKLVITCFRICETSTFKGVNQQLKVFIEVHQIFKNYNNNIIDLFFDHNQCDTMV